MTTGSPSGFVPPPYPYDRLQPIQQLAAERWGMVVDLSVGTPFDPPSPAVLATLSSSADRARAYPPSVGTAQFRSAAADWMSRRLGIDIDEVDVAATIGSKEFVAGLPHWLKLRSPERDTVLYPEVAYPSYEMGALLASCRAVPVASSPAGGIDLTAIDPSDAARALCLWVNSPANPDGSLTDLAAAAEWGRTHGVPVFSDECYVEFTWDGPPVGADGLPGDSILRYGTEGVIAVHSLSKRSNLAGMRAGFYAGDHELVHYLSEVRKHTGLMVPGPVQAAAIAALGDTEAVLAQRDRYARRLRALAEAVESVGLVAPIPAGGFYLWCHGDGLDGWQLAHLLAERLGMITSPGEFYGAHSADRVRIAAVVGDEQIELVVSRS